MRSGRRCDQQLERRRGEGRQLGHHRHRGCDQRHGAHRPGPDLRDRLLARHLRPEHRRRRRERRLERRPGSRSAARVAAAAAAAPSRSTTPPRLSTTLASSNAIYAQSIGGGGGQRRRHGWRRRRTLGGDRRLGRHRGGRQRRHGELDGGCRARPRRATHRAASSPRASAAVAVTAGSPSISALRPTVPRRSPSAAAARPAVAPGRCIVTTIASTGPQGGNSISTSGDKSFGHLRAEHRRRRRRRWLFGRRLGRAAGRRLAVSVGGNGGGRWCRRPGDDHERCRDHHAGLPLERPLRAEHRRRRRRRHLRRGRNGQSPGQRESLRLGGGRWRCRRQCRQGGAAEQRDDADDRGSGVRHRMRRALAAAAATAEPACRGPCSANTTSGWRSAARGAVAATAQRSTLPTTAAITTLGDKAIGDLGAEHRRQWRARRPRHRRQHRLQQQQDLEPDARRQRRRRR